MQGESLQVLGIRRRKDWNRYSVGRKRKMEKYGIGDTCYIIEDGEVRRGRVSAKKGDNFFVQFVGSCGALQVKSEELYRTLEEAQVELDREAQERPHVGYL